jgi:hypothetical protein
MIYKLIMSSSRREYPYEKYASVEKDQLKPDGKKTVFFYIYGKVRL